MTNQKEAGRGNDRQKNIQTNKTIPRLSEKSKYNCYDFDEIKSKCNCLDIAKEIDLNVDSSGRCAAVWRNGTNPSSVAINEKGFYDHKAKISGSVIDLVALVKFNGDIQESTNWLGKRLHLMPKQQSSKSTQKEPFQVDASNSQADKNTYYDYTDEKGCKIFQVVRSEQKGKLKRFSQRTPKGGVSNPDNENRNHWDYNLKAIEGIKEAGNLPLYNLPAIINPKTPQIAVLFVEGEKDVDTARKYGIHATCNAGGAGNVRGFDLSPLKGRIVYIIPDNDSAGYNGALKVHDKLKGIASKLKILKLPINKEKTDLTDYIKQLENENLNADQIRQEIGNLFRNPENHLSINQVKILAGVPEEQQAESESLDGFPPLADIGELLKNPPKLYPMLIEGVLRKGWKMQIAGSSGSGKSFLLLSLALSIAHGREWLGFKCHRKKVLYINTEIDKASFIERLGCVSKEIFAPDIIVDAEYFHLWNLRGKTQDVDKLMIALMAHIKEHQYDLIIIDPIYKIIDGEESSSQVIKKLINRLDEIVETGPAVVYCHHFSKGDQGQKSAMDRNSGSGVLARDPDVMITLTELAKTKNAFCFEVAKARNFATPEPFPVVFQYPLHYCDASLKHEPLKGEERGRKSKKLPSAESVISLVKEKPLRKTVLKNKLNERLGVPFNKFPGLIAELLDDGKLKEFGRQGGKKMIGLPEAIDKLKKEKENPDLPTAQK